MSFQSISLDTILQERIGMGNGQLSQFVILGLISFQNGFAAHFFAILISILKNEWQLTNFQVVVMSSIFFFGMIWGLLFEAFYSDKFGRKKILKLAMFGTFIGVFSHIFVQSFGQVLLLRLLFGFLFGVTIPISLILMSEQVPKNFRGRVVGSLQLMYLLGIFYLLICCYLYLEDFSHGNWRAIFMLNSIPALLCYLGTYYFVKESPRFTLVIQKYSKAFQRLNVIGQENSSSFTTLNRREKDGLIGWQQEMKHHQHAKSVSELFKNENRQITISIWCIMFLWGLQCTSIFLLIPFIYQESGYGFGAMFISYSWELVATFIIISFIDSKDFGGRKRMIVFGLFLTVFAQFMMVIYKTPSIVLGMTLIRVSDKIVWMAVNQLKIESYVTYYRTLGVGMADAVGKTASFFASFLAFLLFHLDPYLPFLIFGCLSILNIILCLFHPVDLTQEPLDDGLFKKNDQKLL